MTFHTSGGFFEVMTYQPLKDDRKRGVTCKIFFHPSANAGDSAVGLVQACHAIKFSKSTNAWENYLTSAAGDEILSDAGWFIDAGGSENPVFAMAIDQHKDMSTRFRLEEGVPSGWSGGNGGYGRYNASGLQGAFIDDEPKRTFTMGKQSMKHEFETAALCLTGPFAGKCLGTIHWGYEVDASDNLNRIRLQAADSPSDRWRGAASAWNDRKQIKIPLLG